MKVAAALLSGLLFGAGLCLSGMTWPAKVVGFLDIAGAWDPSLAFVMAGAVGTYAFASRLIRRRGAPVLAASFESPPTAGLDTRLLAGAAVFGVGWGLSGYCPGPAVVSLAGLAPYTVAFVGAVVVGMLAAKRLVFAAVLVTFVSAMPACGGGDLNTGVFVGPVMGLHYESLTQSGITDGKGEFRYADGETVTFTVGGVVLGTTKGRAQLSAFDLFGMAPVTDVLELRRLLTDDVVTDFDRVANIALFLLAVDADRDSTNGLDVTGWGAELAGVPLAFDEDFADFAFGTFQRFAAAHPGIDRHVDAAAALPHLYASLGIVVPARVLAGYSADFDGDGVAEQLRTYATDAQGRVVLVRIDNGADGTFDREESSSYNARGQSVSHESRTDLDLDGDFERVEAVTYGFDADGNAVQIIAQDTTNGVVGLKQTYTSIFDVAGNELMRTLANDNGGNGSVESRSVETATYDGGGRRLSTRREIDSDGNGTPDSVSLHTSTFDGAGTLTQSTTETDSDADGTFESREVVGYTADTADTERYAGAVLVSRAHGVFSYDAEGHQTSAGYEEDDDVDGDVDYRTLNTATFTADGRPLLQTYSIDSNGDGTFDHRVTVTRAYDAASNLASEITDTDAGADGSIETRVTDTRTYDAFGNLLTRTRQGNDETVETRTYSDIADGLYKLVYELVID